MALANVGFVFKKRFSKDCFRYTYFCPEPYSCRTAKVS